MNISYCRFPLIAVCSVFLLSSCLEKPKKLATSVWSEVRQIIYEQLPDFSASQYCSQNLLLDGVAPQIGNAAFKRQTRQLCFEEFALSHSAISKGPLWVAEALSPQKVAAKIQRQGKFHAEERLPESERSELSDYKGSRYDRGHLAASGNMSTQEAQQESFSLANIVPQNPKNNQQLWRNIEEATRTQVGRSRETAYIVTGAAYLNRKITAIGAHKVLVPSHLYKAVYRPASGTVGVYWTANTANAKAQIISVCALEEKTGVNAFPTLSQNLRRARHNLPMTSKAVAKNGAIPALKRDNASSCSPTLSPAAARNQIAQFE